MKDSFQEKAAQEPEKQAGAAEGKSSDIISVLKTEVRDFDVRSGATETGFITKLGDGYRERFRYARRYVRRACRV